jgi:hypothetical protein
MNLAINKQTHCSDMQHLKSREHKTILTISELIKILAEHKNKSLFDLT